MSGKRVSLQVAAAARSAVRARAAVGLSRLALTARAGSAPVRMVARPLAQRWYSAPAEGSPEWRAQAYPEELLYTKDHEYVRIEGGVATLGLSAYAVGRLADLVYVEIPDIGTQVEAGEAVSVVESVKSASEVYSPVSGTVTEVNEAVADKPALINTSPYGDGWICRIELADAAQVSALAEAKELLSSAEYDAFIREHDGH
ncbi:glycine cleavage H-protein-domain-containing protein [Dipodascopsis tothii]|uniref:glycine cleavage H-protein-domain-containing protein n=1 Tax=Dipodascopsis tothii TaxID=44089 RepID=UPI0034CE0652